MADVTDNDPLLLLLRNARPDSHTLDPTSAAAHSLLNRLVDDPRGREPDAAGLTPRSWVPLTSRTSPRSGTARRIAVGSLAAATVAGGVAGALALAGGASSKADH